MRGGPGWEHSFFTHTHTPTINGRWFLTLSAAALVSIGPVEALGAVLAGRAGALIDVDLTHGARKPWDRQTQG